MSDLNCASCSSLQEDAPDFVLNGVNTTAYDSLAANTGLNPNLQVLHTDEEDLNNVNDCLIGMLQNEVEGQDQCNWRDFTGGFLSNLYETLKAIIAAVSGLWSSVGTLNEKTEPIYVQATGIISSEASGTSHTKVTLGAKEIENDPNGIFSIDSGGVKVSEAGIYRVSGMVYTVTAANTYNLGAYVYKGPDYANSVEVVGAMYGVGDNGLRRPVYSGARLVTLAANDIVFLCSRTTNDVGSVIPNADNTFLLIEKIK